MFLNLVIITSTSDANVADVTAFSSSEDNFISVHPETSMYFMAGLNATAAIKSGTPITRALVEVTHITVRIIALDILDATTSIRCYRIYAKKLLQCLNQHRDFILFFNEKCYFIYQRIRYFKDADNNWQVLDLTRIVIVALN